MQSIFRDTSPLICRDLQKDILPGSVNAAGLEGIAAQMTPDDAQKCFLIWAAVVRAALHGVSIFQFASARKDERLGKYRGLVYFLAAHFALHGMCGVKDHLCSDFCFKASSGDGIITNCVVGGVTATCPVCSNGTCGEELANMQTDRFCPAHVHLHEVCGVMESPGGGKPCGKPTSTKTLQATPTGAQTDPSASGNEDSRDSTAWRKRRVTCDEHDKLERIWRDDKSLSEEYTSTVRLRKAKMRFVKADTRWTNPVASDHCASGGGSSASGCNGA